MRVISSIREMKLLAREKHRSGLTIGFVPTMGYLHEGHLTLMKEAKKKSDFVVVSIFVNPLQFGVGEDYEEYPRDLTRDTALAEKEGVDVIFAPSVREMYPKGYRTFINVEDITDKLCGRSRPGHFRGVTTVVTKLFNIVDPDFAFFGQKDAQQSIVIQKMVEDLNMNVQVNIIPTVREADGLAMSSRNSYLSPEERKAALVLYKSLQEAERLIKSGHKDPKHVKSEMIKLINNEPLARIDYVEIMSVPELIDVEIIQGRILIALAVFIGRTRLIDNMVLEV